MPKFGKFNSLINVLFWSCLGFSILYFYFNKFLQILLKSHKIKQYKCKPTVRYVWNISFFAASLLFLHFYHKYFIAPRIYRELGPFPKYASALFLPTDNCSIFDSISLILITFYVTAIFLDLREKDFSEAASKCLYVLVLLSFDSYGYENYSVILNLILGLYSLFTDCLLTASLHTLEKHKGLFRIYLFLRIITWSYIFLNLLPFKYLIPTLNAKIFKLWLNVFLWMWYGSTVWNSPILQYFYHKIYHTNSYDCIGNNSISRCIMLKDSPDIQHFKNLQEAFLEVSLAKQKTELPAACIDNNNGNTGNASAAAYQTVKCMMTLKRKLKRIRQKKEHPE